MRGLIDDSISSKKSHKNEITNMKKLKFRNKSAQSPKFHTQSKNAVFRYSIITNFEIQISERLILKAKNYPIRVHKQIK